MIIDCISDLHGFYPKLDGGDLLIVAGDLTCACALEFQMELNSWLYSQSKKYKKIVVIAGNQDNHLLHEKPSSFYFSSWNPQTGEQKSYAEYLCDSGTEFEYEVPSDREYGANEGPIGIVRYDKKRLKIWGSPWTLRFEGMNPNCMAFTVDTEEELADKWESIPDDIDILVTHTPPHGCYLDQDRKGNMLGSISLRDKLYPFTECKTKLHVFGHIHEGHGFHPLIGQPNHVNASHVNERYEPVNKPIRIEL